MRPSVGYLDGNPYLIESTDMSTALRIVHGNFGRVALLDMDFSLVRHAHPHCHVLLKVEGADTQFNSARSTSSSSSGAKRRPIANPP
jgi:hypothetical protein